MIYSTRLAVAGSLLSFFSVPVLAWQTEVHNQIGFMAEAFLHQEAVDMIARVLEPEYKGSIGRAAGWADGVRRDPHPYSYGWHFISAKDNPPDDCGLYYHRDCQAGGCVVQQIANQTNILKQCLADSTSNKYSGNVTCSEALKWVVHFIGDVAQPLHTSERSYGGNSVKVKFNGTDTNLHQAWDKVILYAEKNISPSGTELHPYFADLVSRIERDEFRSPRSTWVLCDLDTKRGTYCAEQWAKDSNAIVCDYAYGRYVNGSDLLTGPEKYAEGAVHIIEEQIAKAAVRMAGWLNSLSLEFADQAKVESVDPASIGDLRK